MLVKSLRVKYAKLKPLERCLFDLRAMLLKLPAKAGVTSRALKLRGIKLFQQHSSEITLDFAPPAAVDVVGSFLLHTLSRPALNVDLAVTMPASCFSRKDTVNHRYHDKRSLYLGVIAKAVGRSKAFKSVYFEAMHRDTSKPVLVLVPTAAPKFKIRVHVAVAPGTFQSHRLAPTFSNVRPAVTGLVAARDSSEDDAAASSPATPHYNTSILQDVHKQLQLKTFHEVSGQCGAHVKRPCHVACSVDASLWIFSPHLMCVVCTPFCLFFCWFVRSFCPFLVPSRRCQRVLQPRRLWS